MLSLEETIQLILKNLPKYERNDVLKMIEEKRQELGPDVVNEESAAMIVARELGIDLHQVAPKSRLKISDITESTRNVILTAKVANISPVRTFSRKDGGEGKVASIIVIDDSGSIRVALWDDMTRAVSEDAIDIGSVIQIRGAYVKRGLRDVLELNLGRMGAIRVLEDYEIEEIGIDFKATESMKIDELKPDVYDVSLTVKVDRVFPLSTFTRKSDDSEGKVVSMIVADDTASTRLVFWDDQAEEMQDAEPGEIISITGVYTKKGRGGELEVHGGRSTQIERDLKVDLDAVEVESGVTAKPLGRKTIDQMEIGMRDVDLEGKVVKIFDVTTFEREGTQGRVQNIIVTDESGQTVRLAFWHDDVDKIKDLKEGDLIRVLHGYVKKGFRDDIEFGVGNRAEIEINPKDVESEIAQIKLSDVSTAPKTKAGRVFITDIDKDSANTNVEICGFVVQVGQTAPVYPSCPECMKKVQETEKGKFACPQCGPVKKPQYRMLYKVTIDDGTGSIRTTLFGEAGELLLGMSADEAQKLIEETGDEKAPIAQAVDSIMGSYVVINGRVRKYRDSLDLSASGLKFADPEKEIERKKAAVQDLLD